jgi:hypothetical protein
VAGSAGFAISNQAQQIAAMARTLNINIPAEVTAAVTACEAAAKMTTGPPPPDPGQVLAAQAADLARATLADPAALADALDPAPAAAARQAQQAHADRTSLAAEVQAALERQLVTTVRQHQGAVVGAIQARYATVTGQLASRAARLPLGIDDQAALRSGEKVRADFLAALDLLDEAAQLRAAVAVAAGTAPPPDAQVDRVAAATAYEKTGALVKHWTVDGLCFGQPPGSLAFYTAAALTRERFEWWCPPVAALHARAAELRQEAAEERVRQTVPSR